MEKENIVLAELKDRLRQALADNGMKAADLVEKTGVPKGAISYYLAGKSQPKADRLYIIARALDVSEAWLLGYDVQKTRTPEQKKNDDLVKAIAKMRSDAELFDLVSLLMELPPEQRPAVKTVLAALCNK